MDKSVIDAFWKKRSAEGKGRWTDDALLQYELNWLSKYATPHVRILDLGSGPGELSSRLLPADGSLTLVEKYPDFLTQAPTGQNIRHVCCDVENFDYPESYDLILLFGVVTHLLEEEEIFIYRQASKHLTPSGRLIVKNQVSQSEEKLVSGYSENLHEEYCGRYPGINEQLCRMQSIFSNVEVFPYPDQFNPWPDTKHVAFVCR